VPPQIFNYQLISGTNRQPTGGFKHWSGFQPFSANSGDPFHASVRNFHVPPTNSAAIFRGDPVLLLGTADSALTFGNSLYQNQYPNGGAPVGNIAETGDVGGYTAGNTSGVFAGVVVGWELTLAAAKNGQPFIPAGVEAWLHVETDPLAEFYVTAGGATLPTGGWPAAIGAGIDTLANNTAYQSTKFGISGLSIDPTTVAATSTLPFRILSAPVGINNDVTDAPTGTTPNFIGNPVIRVQFNQTRHMMSASAFVA
jgi:hypothetical protein